MIVCLIVYDNDAFIHVFPIGIGYLVSFLCELSHEMTIYNQDVYYYPETHLTEFLTNNQFDVVGVGIIGEYYQYWKLLKISEAIANVPTSMKLCESYPSKWTHRLEDIDTLDAIV